MDSDLFLTPFKTSFADMPGTEEGEKQAKKCAGRGKTVIDFYKVCYVKHEA